MPVTPSPPPQEPSPQPPAHRGPGVRLILVGALVGAFVLVLGAGAAWFFLARGAGPAKAAEAKAPPHVWKAGTIVVNVAGTEGRRYLRTTLELGVAPKEAKHLEELRAPLLDAAIEVLASKRLEQLFEPNERDKLKDELKTHLNAALGHPRISHIFLTEFVVQ